MEKEVETWNSALLPRAIHSATVSVDTDNRLFCQFHITSGISFMTFNKLMHIFDMVIVVSQEHLL